MTARECAWCEQPLREGMRRDAKFCSTPCRQSSHRFGKGAVARRRTTAPIRIVYADPPYPGKAHLYAGHPDYGGEVDHLELLARLAHEKAWALSSNSQSLQMLLGFCSELRVRPRVASWVRGARSNAQQVHPLRAWEVVLYAGGRMVPSGTTDVLIHRARPRTSDPGVAGLVGTKPAEFYYWLFDLMGALPGDDFVDLFPGSGGGSRAWDVFDSKSKETEG